MKPVRQMSRNCSKIVISRISELMTERSGRRQLSQASRDGDCHGMGGARVGVRIARHVPARVELHPYVGQSGVVENPAPQNLIGRILWGELRHENEWYRSAR